MAFIIEDGSGVEGANSYMSIGAVATYLTERGRNTAWDAATTAVKQAALIEATDYIEQRFGRRFRGMKEWTDLSTARAVYNLSIQAVVDQTVTIGSTVYTFKATASGAAYTVAIGSTIAETLDNLMAAINASGTAAVDYGVGTVKHPTVSAQSFYGLTLLILANAAGLDGNTIALASTAGTWNNSFTTLRGGNNVVEPQHLAFPRSYLYDRDGVLVVGIPHKLKFATAEYAARALADTLLPDPTVDPTGRNVKKKLEKVGPIEQETTYESGLPGQILKSYPAADRHLVDYLFSESGAYRG
jgi:hypothetical protein